MSYPIQDWRLLITPPARGSWNMAVDEAISESVEQQHVLPTMRLYSWDPACLSIGYAQSTKDIDRKRLHQMGWEWVRRPTGGRAILHTDELTYSIIAPLSDPRVCGSVLESYQRISMVLITALQSIKIPALSKPNEIIEKTQRNAPVCFEVPSNYEIVVNAKKLIGSAQARHRNMLLQHGTLPLYGDLTRITWVLNYPDEEHRSSAAIRLLDHATTVETILNEKITLEQVQQAFISSFQSEFNLNLRPSQLTEQEQQHAQFLVQEKYAHASWLERI